MARFKVKGIDGLIQTFKRDFKSASVEFGYGRKSGKPKRSSRKGMPDRGDITYADIANMAEWGAEIDVFGNVGVIPMRPFFSEAVDNFKINEGEIKFGMIRNGVLQSKWIVDVMCENLKYQIKYEIENGNWAPNEPLTIRLKGSDKPLVETGGLGDAAVQQQKVREFCV